MQSSLIENPTHYLLDVSQHIIVLCLFLLNVPVALYFSVQDAQLLCLSLCYLRVPLLLQGQFDVEEASGLQLHTQLLTATPYKVKAAC